MKIVKIHSTVPLAPKRSGPLPKRKKHHYQISYADMSAKVRILEVGQSFKVAAKDTRELQRRMAGVIGPSYQKGTAIYRRRFSLRQVGDGVRVWRVK